mmetsp:Transcript_57579/g.162388  ORF Transcript_57579/g.162388 Transcript_57579/m.162388 type:complete len:474 (+) Transcript_57579:86-1507(+)
MADQRCIACGKPGAPARCGRCLKVFFCDKECQRRGWPQHKPACNGDGRPAPTGRRPAAEHPPGTGAGVAHGPAGHGPTGPSPSAASTASRTSAQPPSADPCGEGGNGFELCQPAAVQLGRRWAAIRQEGRFEQLRWEAARVAAREPRWATVRATLCMALTELGRYAEARLAARAGAELSPHDPVWPQLVARVEALEERGTPAGRHGPRPPPPGQRAHVVVASLFHGEAFIEAMRPARENHARWCALHGYTYACFEENFAGRSDPTWSKIPIVQRLLREGAQYVFWMDADSLFIHDGVDLQWLCELDKDFAFAGDLNVVFNAGHFLARQSAWVTRFLDDAFRIHPWPDWEDNGAMMIMLGGGSADRPDTWRPAFERMKVPTQTQDDCSRAMRELLPPDVASHVAVVPQHRLNSYEWPRGGGMHAVVHGDPILHFAGCSAAEKPGLTAKFAKCTGDPEVLLRLCGRPGVDTRGPP